MIYEFLCSFPLLLAEGGELLQKRHLVRRCTLTGIDYCSLVAMAIVIDRQDFVTPLPEALFLCPR